jgi:hypothetical protein
VAKKDRLAEIVRQVRTFRFCGPSDDPDEQTAVTAGYRHLLVQLKRLATPVLPEAEAARLNGLDVEINNIYSVYEPHAEVDALLPAQVEPFKPQFELLLQQVAAKAEDG